MGSTRDPDPTRHMRSHPGAHRDDQSSGSAPAECRRASCPAVQIPIDQIRRKSLAEFNAAPRNDSERKFVRLILLVKVAVIAGFIALLATGYVFRKEALNGLEVLLSWVSQGGIISCIVFVLVYGVITALFFPAEMLTLASGLIFASKETFGFAVGFPVAVVASWAGGLLGSTIAFFAGRYLLYKPIRLWCRGFRMYHAMMKAVKAGGTTFVFLLRMSPIVPLAISNYLLGVTAIDYYCLVVGSFGSLFVTCLLVWVGCQFHTVNDILHKQAIEVSPLYISLTALGVLAAGAAIGYVAWLTKQKLREVEADPELQLHMATAFAGVEDSEYDWACSRRPRAPSTALEMRPLVQSV